MGQKRDSPDWDCQSTASLPAKDCQVGQPCPRTRSSSADDVSRFHRYFQLLSKNLGPHFIWNMYARLLHDALGEYRTPDIPMDVEKKKDVGTQTPTLQSPPTELLSSTPLCLETEPLQRISMRRRCRDMLVRVSPSSLIGSPLSRLTSRKLSVENKSLVRDISSRIDRITTLTRKKSSKQRKPTFNKKGYTPLSSGYSSSEKAQVPSSGSASSLRPLKESSSGKHLKTRKKIKMEVVEYVY